VINLVGLVNPPPLSREFGPWCGPLGIPAGQPKRYARPRFISAFFRLSSGGSIVDNNVTTKDPQLNTTMGTTWRKVRKRKNRTVARSGQKVNTTVVSSGGGVDLPVLPMGFAMLATKNACNHSYWECATWQESRNNPSSMRTPLSRGAGNAENRKKNQKTAEETGGPAMPRRQCSSHPRPSGIFPSISP